MLKHDALYRIKRNTLVAMLVAAFLLAATSVYVAAQPPSPSERFVLLEAYLPPEAPDAPPQPAPPEAPPHLRLLEAFSPPEASPQPLTHCWNYLNSAWCDTVTHQRWEYWCHRCCNEPDYCPTGCCDIYCWWVEAGTR